jgi:HSP20 family protein
MTVLTVNPARRAPQRTVRPSVNVIESSEAYRIEMLVPGLDKSDIVLELEDDILRIRGTRQEENETDSATYLRREFRPASFERSFQLPENVDGEQIGASYAKGILSIDLPWKEEAKPQPPRAIEVK